MMTTTAALTTLTALAAVSAATGAVGSMMSSQAQQDAANYNAAVARNNAGAARQQAQFDAEQIRDRNKRILAQQRNAFAANGIDSDSGTATDVSGDSALQGEMQALMAIYTGRTSATAGEAQAKLFQMNAQNARTAGYINVSNNLLSGATDAVSLQANPNFRT